MENLPHPSTKSIYIFFIIIFIKLSYFHNFSFSFLVTGNTAVDRNSYFSNSFGVGRNLWRWFFLFLYSQALRTHRAIRWSQFWREPTWLSPAVRSAQYRLPTPRGGKAKVRSRLFPDPSTSCPLKALTSSWP